MRINRIVSKHGRFLIVALLFCCLAALLGCAGKSETFVPFEKSKNLKQLRVGLVTDYPPLAFEDAGQVAGVEVDLAKVVAFDLNREIVFKTMAFDDLIPALVGGRIDIIMSGMSITPARERQVAFAQPYLQAGQMALIRANERSQFPDRQSLVSTRLRVGYVRDTTGAQFVEGHMPNARRAPQDSIEQGVQALRSATIDVFIHDAPTIWRIAGNPTEEELTGLFWPLTDEYLAWAVRPSDALLLKQLNDVLNRVKENGGLQAILKRWIPMRIEVGS
jgi:polar amino acid transport system substrate-binding protein